MKQEDIYIIYGDKPKEMIKQVLSNIRIEAAIDKNARIGIKPNLVVAKPSTSGATTSPELVAGVIEYLKEKGYSNLLILEGSWVGDMTSSAFKVCGYEKLSKQYGVPLIDLQKDSYKSYDSGEMKINVCDEVKKLVVLV